MSRPSLVVLALMLALLIGAAAAQEAATPTAPAGASAIVVRPAHIHTGSCAALGEVVYPLTDLPTVAVRTVPTLTAVGQSTTTVAASLDDLLAGEHAVNVHASADDLATSIACGDLTGTVMGGELALPLGAIPGSGFTGEAVLRDGGDGTTTVTLVLVGLADPGSVPAAAAAVPGATPATEAAVPAGTVVATTSENVNVRAEPTTAAEILATLETGATLEVTGDPEEADGFRWYPVILTLDDAELTGWVAADFVAPVADAG